jgi:hypothetical protein
MDDLIIPKIELIELQIENFERSGFFTEKQMDTLTFPLKIKLESLNQQLNLHGMTLEEYKEGRNKHQFYFSQMKSRALLNTWKTLGMNASIAASL